MPTKKIKEKNTTIRIKESTKVKLINLKFVKKGMSYDEIINQIIKIKRKK